MRGTYSQAPYIRPSSPLWASSFADRAQNRRSFCIRIRQRGLEGRRGLNTCGCPAGMPTVSRAGSRNWFILSRVTQDRHMFVDRDPPQFMWRFPLGELRLSPQRPVKWRRRNSSTGPSRCRSPRCTRPRPTARGSYRYPGHIGHQTGENAGGFSVTLPAHNFFGPVCLPSPVCAQNSHRHPTTVRTRNKCNHVLLEHLSVLFPSPDLQSVLTIFTVSLIPS